jgi:hypothetical protein
MNYPSKLVVLLAAFGLVLCAYLLVGMVIEKNSCSMYINSEESPVPTMDYFKIPDHCINHTRLYPDEAITTKSGITFTYYELPDIGSATITSGYTIGGTPIFNMVESGRDYRGRFAINETHHLFEAITDTNTQVVDISTNACYQRGLANGS